MGMNEDDVEKAGVSVDDINRWREELQKWMAAKAEAEVHIDEYRKKIRAAVRSIFGTSLPALLAILGGQHYDSEELFVEGRESLRQGIRRILHDAPGPISHDAVRAELRKVPRFDQLLERNEGSYYFTMISRLLREGEIRRAGKHLIVRVQNDPSSEANPEAASP